MAGQKPNTFPVASEFPAGMEYYFQDSSDDEYRVPHALLLTQLAEDGVIMDPGTVTKTDGQTISFLAGQLLLALIITPSASMTFSVGTTDDGDDIIESQTVAAKTVFVINYHFTADAVLYFNLSTGSVTVHVKKI